MPRLRLKPTTGTKCPLQASPTSPNPKLAYIFNTPLRITQPANSETIAKSGCYDIPDKHKNCTDPAPDQFTFQRLSVNVGQ